MFESCIIFRLKLVSIYFFFLGMACFATIHNGGKGGGRQILLLSTTISTTTLALTCRNTVYMGFVQ